MATVQLSDIIDTVVYQDLPPVNSPEKTAFFESGMAIRNGLLDSIASQPGATTELPFWNDLDASVAPNLSTDNPNSTATPQNVAQGKQVARKAYLNQGWSASDLASEIAMGSRAMDQIRARVERYWTRQWQRRVIDVTNGVLADNVANDSSDMVHDVALDTGTTSSVFTRANFTSAAFTLGDAFENTGALAVHSVVYKRILDSDDIEFIRDSEGNLTIPTYLGHRVIVYDGMTVDENGANDAKYTSILFGAGAFGWGDGQPEVPVAVEREESQGDGGGIETLWTRKTWLVHPFGFKVDATPAGNSFTRAELSAAATWDRVVDRKNTPIAFLVTNA